MTYILHIESATKCCSVALSCNGNLIALEETTEDGYAHGENLTLFIDKILKDNQLNPSNLSAISVASGPGSYTGLRIGVSTAKGLCYGLSIPLISVDALFSLKEIATEKHSDINLCALIDARRMEVYSSLYSPDGKIIKEISADIITSESYQEYEPFVFFGDGAEKLQETWKGKERIADLSIFSSAKGQIRLAYQKFLEKNFEDVAYFEPFYLKDFIAGKPSVK